MNRGAATATPGTSPGSGDAHRRRACHRRGLPSDGRNRTPLRRRGLDREQLIRILTFWLRPAFILRVVNRFQQIAGFDRAVALASSALTALIPLAIVSGAIMNRLGVKDFADRIIERYQLTGGGADAVRDVFAPASGTTTSVGLTGALILLVTVLSFTRAVQRLFEQDWELTPLSVRNTLNGALWSVTLMVYLIVVGGVHAVVGRGRLELGASLLVVPLTAVFFLWSGWILSAKRIGWRDLVPFGVAGSLVNAMYSVGATVYVPHLFNTYATRYGVIGAVFAMISTLFCVTLIAVGCAALGREVSDELARIRRGERPPEHEVREQWAKVLAEARSRWAAVERRINRR